MCRATTRPAAGGLLDECHSARLELVAQALHAAHAFDMADANEIQAELALALGGDSPAKDRPDRCRTRKRTWLADALGPL